MAEPKAKRSKIDLRLLQEKCIDQKRALNALTNRNKEIYDLIEQECVLDSLKAALISYRLIPRSMKAGAAEVLKCIERKIARDTKNFINFLKTLESDPYYSELAEDLISDYLFPDESEAAFDEEMNSEEILSSSNDSSPKLCESHTATEQQASLLPDIAIESSASKYMVVPSAQVDSSVANSGKKSYDLEMPEGQEIRKYQMELAQPGINGENYIIVAPTGCGKTTVAALVISDHLKKNKGHVIFIVQNRVLAEQQDGKLCNYIPDADVDHCIGGGSLDVFDSIKYNDITVCTAGKLLDELKNGSVNFDSIGLLVFDECHHTVKQQVGEHNYAQVMYHLFEHREKKGYQPQVIGMTASPGAGKNPQVTVERTISHLKNLIAVLNATSGIKTVSENVEELRRFSPKSTFILKFVKSREVEEDPLVSAISMEMNKLEAKVTNEKIYAAKWSQKYLNHARTLQRAYEESDDDTVRDRISALSLLVCYCRALMNYMEIETINAIETIKAFDSVSVDDRATPYEKVIMKDRNILLEKLHGIDLEDNTFLEKMKELLWDADKCEPKFSRGMVFVHTKKYAYSLCDWAKKHPNLGEQIKPVVITGHTGADSMSQDKQRDIVEGFRKGETNLLIATSVAEEGLDVPDCNLVIRYHYVSSSVSKRQVEGRLRADDGQGFTILASNSKKRYTDLRNEELNKLVDEILERDMLPTGVKLKEMIQDIQRGIMEKRKKEAAKMAILKKNSEGKNVTLICRKCKDEVCHGSDIYKLDNHHVVPDSSFLKKVVKSENRKKGDFIVPNKVIKTWKMKCKKCNMKWGNICTFNDYGCEFPILKCSDFIFKKVDGRTQKWKQWKDVPYEIQQLDVKMKLTSD